MQAEREKEREREKPERGRTSRVCPRAEAERERERERDRETERATEGEREREEKNRKGKNLSGLLAFRHVRRDEDLVLIQIRAHYHVPAEQWEGSGLMNLSKTTLSDTMYLSISFRRSTPHKTVNLIF